MKISILTNISITQFYRSRNVLTQNIVETKFWRNVFKNDIKSNNQHFKIVLLIYSRIISRIWVKKYEFYKYTLIIKLH